MLQRNPKRRRGTGEFPRPRFGLVSIMLRAFLWRASDTEFSARRCNRCTARGRTEPVA